jgi:hypothetical protein
MIERVDFHWSQGFISMEEYAEKWLELDLEISSLRAMGISVRS